LITIYEVRNVLRVYGNKLKRKSTQVENSGAMIYDSVDLVDISMSARRRQMLSQISNQLISKMAPGIAKNRELEQQVPASKIKRELFEAKNKRIEHESK
jgi:hypothetical protein